ncbi:MAG: hypothetical protein A2X12_03680 [Bacteroidetes bacterium GWE2_29_8]|nr:MAG: hypothetical protein A2X12_03680 [Bacteroidetes bacterium GWE2_29_8]
MENTENKIRTFEDLEVWRVNRFLSKKLSSFAKTLPLEEQERMSDNLIRSGRHITNCIAEGYGRFEYQENIDLCRQARATIYKIIDNLIICLEEEFINEEELEDFRNDCNKSIQFINGYIRHLLRKKRNKEQFTKDDLIIEE